MTFIRPQKNFEISSLETNIKGMIQDNESIKTAENIQFQGQMRLVVSNRNSLKPQELEESNLPAILEKEIKRPSSSRVQRRRKSQVKWAKFAIAEELVDIWSIFYEQHWQSKRTPRIILDVINLQFFDRIIVLAIEDKQLDQIFQYLQPCQQLQAVLLKNNRIITRDLTFMSSLKSLIKLDLSNNGIHFLPEAYQLQRLQKLEFLFLHQNQLVGWRQIELLTCLNHLRHLTLNGNPCAKVIGYRQFLISSMPELRCLDEFIVGDFERPDMQTMYPESTFRGDKLRQLKRFKPNNPKTQSYQSQPFLIEGMYLDKGFFYTHSEHEISKHIQREHYLIRRKFEWCSPILTIQKTARMFLARRRYKKIKRQIQILYWALNRMHLRLKLIKLIKKLGLTPQMLRIIGKVRKIQKRWREYQRRKAYTLQTAERLQSIFRMQKEQNVSFITALRLDLNNQSTKKRLIFTKKQLQLCSQLCIDQYFDDIEVLTHVALKKNINFDAEEHRISPLLSLIKASYKMVKLIEPHKYRRLDSGIDLLSNHLVPDNFTRLKARLKPRMLKRRRKHVPQADPNIINQNNALIAVSFANDAMLAKVFRKIIQYNRTHDNILLVFYEQFVQQFRSKIMIQRWIKGSLLRHNQRQIFQTQRLSFKMGIDASKISVHNTVYAHFAVAMRAIRFIQSAFKMWRLKMRIGCLTQIARYASQINSNVIFLDQNVYNNLARLQDQRNKSIFQEQNFNFLLLDHDGHVRVNFPLNKDKTGRYIQKSFPQWFIDILECQIPLMLNNKPQISSLKFSEAKSGSQIEKTCFTLIHTANHDEPPSVVQLSQYYEVGQQQDDGFVRVKFSDILEAKCRAVLIAILTSNYLKGSTIFAQFYTQQQLGQIQKVQTDTKQLLSAYKIVEQPIKKLQISLEIQKHDGIITKRIEPYRGIIRSQPKQKNKKDYDRLIVLSDANPILVDLRIAEIMKQHNLETKKRPQKKLIFERAEKPKNLKEINQEQQNVSSTIQQQSVANTKDKLRNSIFYKSTIQIDQQSIKGQVDSYSNPQLNQSLQYEYQLIQQKMQNLAQKIQGDDDTNKDYFVKTLIPTMEIEKQTTDSKALVITLPKPQQEFQQEKASNEDLALKVKQIKYNYKQQKNAYKLAQEQLLERIQERKSLYQGIKRSITGLTHHDSSSQSHPRLNGDLTESPEHNSIDQIVNSIYAQSPQIPPKSARDFVNQIKNLNRGLNMMEIQAKKNLSISQAEKNAQRERNKSYTTNSSQTNSDSLEINNFIPKATPKNIFQKQKGICDQDQKETGLLAQLKTRNENFKHNNYVIQPGIKIILPANAAANLDMEKAGLLTERIQQLGSKSTPQKENQGLRNVSLKKLLHYDFWPPKNLMNQTDQTNTHFLSQRNSQNSLSSDALNMPAKQLVIKRIKKVSNEKDMKLIGTKSCLDPTQPRIRLLKKKESNRISIKADSTQLPTPRSNASSIDRDIHLITKSLKPISSQAHTYDVSRTLNSPQQRRQFLIKQIQERVKQKGSTQKLNSSLFAPISRSQFLLPNKSQIMAIGQSKNWQQRPVANKAPLPKYTIEHFIEQRQQMVEKDKKFRNLDDAKLLMHQESEVRVSVQLKLKGQLSQQNLPTISGPRALANTIRDNIVQYKLPPSTRLFPQLKNSGRKTSLTIQRKALLNEFQANGLKEMLK